MMRLRDSIELLVIGGSAGSLSVVLKMLPLFKYIKVPVIIIFHRKANTEDPILIDLLTSRTEYFVKEADDKDELQSNVIYLAPAEYHLLIENNRSLTLDDSEKINYSRPSIDVTFESASEVYKEKLACVLLSGANADGVKGLEAAKKRGSMIIVQDPSTAEASFMPQKAIEALLPDFILTPDNLKELFESLNG